MITCLTCGASKESDGPWNTSVAYCNECVAAGRHLNPYHYSDNNHPDFPMDVRISPRTDGDLEITVQSFYTPNDPRARYWTSASIQRMDAAARRAMPGARVYMRDTYSGANWTTRADGSRYQAARVARYTATVGE